MSVKRLTCLMTALTVIITCIILFPEIFPFIAILILLMVMCFLVNHKAVKIIELQKAPFQIFGEIRNVDYLIIGDMINPSLIVPSDKSFVQIKAPRRSLDATFEILKFASSILDEDNGNVIIAVKKAGFEKSFSVFDAPFLYDLTIKKYGIERLVRLSKIPFIVKPLSTAILLLNIYSKNWKEIECPNSDMIKFCDERSFQLKYYEC